MCKWCRERHPESWMCGKKRKAQVLKRIELEEIASLYTRETVVKRALGWLTVVALRAKKEKKA